MDFKDPLHPAQDPMQGNGRSQVMHEQCMSDALASSTQFLAHRGITIEIMLQGIMLQTGLTENTFASLMPS